MTPPAQPRLAEMLFDLPTIQRVSVTRAVRKAVTERLKSEYGIFTHLCRGGGEWMAFSMPECIKVLAGQRLTKEEKTCGIALMAGYCRLLDEAGVIENDHETEYSAVIALTDRIKAKSPPPNAPTHFS